MGLRRFERVKNSARPAAKLGGGGGWVAKDDADADAPPPFPSALPKRPRKTTPHGDGDGVATTKMKAFSGGGWRAAAPGFGDPEDLAPARPPSSKILLGNLATDVDPDAMRDALTEKCRGLELGDGALVRVTVAVFGPARPMLKRDRNRRHRGFAVAEWSDPDVAAAARERLRDATLTTPTSAKTPGGVRPLKASMEVGPAMDEHFLAGTQGVEKDEEDAAAAAAAEQAERDRAWNMNELRALPMRASCLSTHTTLPDLTPYQRSRVMRYFHDAIDGLPELRDIVALVEAAAPKYTRVKELIESVEAFKLLLAFLATAEHAGGTYNEVETFFDLACGHGLVGVLVAYAFPSRRVVACDRVRRRAFDVYVRAFGAFVAAEDAGTPPPFSHVVEGSPSDETPDASGMGTMPGDAAAATATASRARADAAARAHRRGASDAVVASHAAATAAAEARANALLPPLSPSLLPNLAHIEGEIEAIRSRVNDRSLVLALHGCNEANKESMDMARRADALWCVMPCCVKARSIHWSPYDPVGVVNAVP
jgi:hypothetical protein